MKIENIKFKAKSILDGAWVQGDLIHKEDGKIAILRNGFNVSEVDPSTVCQFTGLKDKNGKEIFENDLLYDEDSGIVSAIKWKRHICGYVYEKAGMFATVHVFSEHTCFLKIVGNKFDRKEGEE